MSTKKLTKQECSEIAEKMTISIQREIDTIDNYFNNLARETLESKVPKDILKSFSADSKEKEYIKTTKSVHIILEHNRWVYCRFKAVPVENTNNTKLKDDSKEKASEMYEKKEALETKKKLLIKQLEEVLYKLSSYKRVSENLPEAIPYLPKVKESELPATNLKEFREMLHKELS